MPNLLERIIVDFPNLNFKIGDHTFWSPDNKTIFYTALDKNENDWELLHELGHAILNHKKYNTDIELLRMESCAWKEAKKVATRYSLDINSDFIDDCVDTYREWLHRRSICPNCNAHGIQTNRTTYVCLNCQRSWKVAAGRFCRPYRQTVK